VTKRHQTRRELVDEQAALRRVATLVAHNVPASELFGAVAREVGTLLGAAFSGMARFEEDAVVVVAASDEDVLPIGSRMDLDEVSASTQVNRTGRSARVDGIDWSAVTGPLSAAAGRLGVVSTVASPIIVEGRPWGALSVSSTDEPLPLETDERLEKFSELVATAIANAESRKALARLADEQAALRRVATLVAQGAQPSEIFSAVCAEVGRLFGTELATIGRFENDPPAVVAIAVTRAPGMEAVEVGSRWKLDDPVAATHVFESGRSVRADGRLRQRTFALDEALDRLGVVSTIASPILVEGRLWGAVIVSSRKELPGDTEERLQKFTELVATAIANAESGEAIARLAEEQAALRRVATLVAQGAPPAEVFAAVSAEVDRVFHLDPATLDVAVVGRFEPGPELVIVGISKSVDVGPLGSRWPPDDLFAPTHVLRTGRSARIRADDVVSAGGEVAELLRHSGYLSQVASPIVVDGRLWGAMLVTTRSDLPPDTEERLAQFTELVATAIANAESREALARLAEEQAALRRVATLVARDVPSTDVFESVATEVGKLLSTDITVVGRYDGDGAATAIGSWSASGRGVPVGTRSVLGGHNVLTIVAETGEPARVDGYAEATGDAADIARRYGWRSSIAAPIAVEGRVWGVMLVATQRPEPFPAGAEGRLAAFTDLVATAVGNAQAHDGLRRFGEEQATLRRIATLVARGVEPEQVFAAVTEETAATFHAITAVMRFEHDPPGIVFVGVSKETGIPIGTRWPFAEGMTSAVVYRTGRSARLGAVDWESQAGPVAEAALRLGVTSQVSCPIIVEGSLWGVITVNAQEELAPDTEARLEKFTELVTTAIANAEGKSELAASRRRIVAASDETRRQIERDLHDGTQQRLVSLGLAVRAAEANLPPERDDLRAQLSGVAKGLVAAVEDLQEISRGIHPAILSKGGLGPALRALAHRSAIPVDLDIATDMRLEEPIEVAAYFVASEALANAAKHSEASRIDLLLEQRDGRLLLSVRDNGVGGADAARGSGLVGLTDRVEALGGSIRVYSRPGKGTQITVELPVEVKLSTTVGWPLAAGRSGPAERDIIAGPCRRSGRLSERRRIR
jgi:signal transduction histidine kinase